MHTNYFLIRHVQVRLGSNLIVLCNNFGINSQAFYFIIHNNYFLLLLPTILSQATMKYSHTKYMLSLLVTHLCLSYTLIAAQSTQGEVTDADADHDEHEDHQTDTFSKNQIWLYGVLASFIVSLLGFLMSGVMILILRSKRLTPSALNFLIRALIAFAVGSLLSDAVVHIIPDVYGVGHADGESEHGHEEETSSSAEPVTAITSLMILVGFVMFVMFERVLEHIGAPHSHGPADSPHIKADGHHHHHHAHTHAHDGRQQVSEVQEDLEAVKVAIKSEPKSETVSQQPSSSNESSPNVADAEKQSEQNVSQDKQPKQPASCFSSIFSLKGRGVTGIMVLLADFIHNAMDGIGIGVTFASGDKTLALSTFIAILAHEIPKEISGMGVLVESNFPLKQAWFCNGVLNFSALIGAVIGLSIGAINEAANAYVMAFVAGNFLYISLCSMLPIVVKERRMKQSMGLMGAFVVGAGIQFALLALE